MVVSPFFVLVRLKSSSCNYSDLLLDGTFEDFLLIAGFIDFKGTGVPFLYRSFSEATLGSELRSNSES